MSSPNFIDYVKFHARSGKGGHGSVHFLRNKSTAKGGPDGGDGGRGGHIIMRGNNQLWTLLHLKYRKHITAQDGTEGKRNNKTGANGKDTIIEVPLGSVAKNADTGDVIGEIVHHKDEVILTHGGRGGKGNTFFTTSVNRAPQKAQSGEPSIEKWFILELKILADVGLVGFPNAGKSTLLATVSAAKPKIADYPFTTLTPNLGIVSYREDRSFVMADIPGIIQGAAMGKGLGTRFLKHIERTSALLFVIPATSTGIYREYTTLLEELKQYNPELITKTRLIAVSKCDLIDDRGMKKLKEEIPKQIPCVFISSLTGQGIMTLKDTLWKNLSSNQKNAIMTQ